MTSEQLYLAIGIPMLLNAAAVTANINAKFHSVDERFRSVDMRDLWRSELHRLRRNRPPP